MFLRTRLREMFDVATPVCKFLCSPTNLPILPITLHNKRCTLYVPQNNITYNDPEATLPCRLSKYILYEDVIFWCMMQSQFIRPYCGGTNTIPFTYKIVRMPHVLWFFWHKGDTPEKAYYVYMNHRICVSINLKAYTAVDNTWYTYPPPSLSTFLFISFISEWTL